MFYYAFNRERQDWTETQVIQVIGYVINLKLLHNLGPVYMRADVKLGWKWKFSACSHETGSKNTNLSIYSPCPPFFTVILWACILPKPKSLKCLICVHSSRSEDCRFCQSSGIFVPISIQTSIINNTLTEMKSSLFDFVPVSCKRFL